MSTVCPAAWRRPRAHPLRLRALARLSALPRQIRAAHVRSLELFTGSRQLLLRLGQRARCQHVNLAVEVVVVERLM